jgi:pectin methylesterase-like acyl-CoA thioesterase
MTTFLPAACVPSAFSGLSLFGAEILSVNTVLVTNYSADPLPLLRIT